MKKTSRPGRPRKHDWELVLRLWRQGMDRRQIADVTGIGYRSVCLIVEREARCER